MRNAYRFVLEVRRLDDQVLYREALVADWEPAVEGARLDGLRTLGVWTPAADCEPWLEPLWHPDAGEPHVGGFRVHMRSGGLAWSSDFAATRYFSDIARQVVSGQLAEGRLSAGERVRFAISAFDVGDAEATGPALRFATADRVPSASVRARAFPDLVAQSPLCGEACGHDIEVVVPASLLDEACALTRAAGDRETGGILLGHLCRDEPPRALGVEVTAQIPAHHTVSDEASLTFTSDTWTDVRAAVALRRAGELIVGWWHSHPAHAWCAECPPDRQRACRLAVARFSADDRVLHRAMFPSAFSVALLVTRSIAGIDTALFGWRGGVLTRRGFRLGGPASPAARRALAATGRGEPEAEAVAPCPSASSRPGRHARRPDAG